MSPGLQASRPWKGREMGSSLELPEGTSPANTWPWSCETDLGPLASRTLRGYICVVISHQVCGLFVSAAIRN